MLWAYFDETVVSQVDGKEGKGRPSEMFVGGCVATAPRWERFNPKWRRALDRARVTAFHAKDFYAFRNEFAWFNKKGERDWNRHGRFRDKLADTILNHVDELSCSRPWPQSRIKGRGRHMKTPRYVRFMTPPNSGYAARIPCISCLLGTLS